MNTKTNIRTNGPSLVIRSLLAFAFTALLLTPLGAIDWGFKFGLSQVSYDYSHRDLQPEFQSRSELKAGVFLSFELAKGLFLQPEVYYARKGADSRDYSGSATQIYRYAVSYIDIPLLLKYEIQAQGWLHPGVFVGPYVGIKYDADFLWIRDYYSERFGERAHIEEYLESLDYGLVLGGDLEFEVCFGRILIDIRYSLGLANILKDVEGLAALYEKEGLFMPNHSFADMFRLNESIKNRALILMLGVEF